jgi:hypothetical protein
MSRGRLSDFEPYPYAHPDEPDSVAMFHIRARVNGDPTRSKHFWYRHGHNDWLLAGDGKPPAELANRLLYRLDLLRTVIRAREELIMWTEGEKDSHAGGVLLVRSGARGWEADTERFAYGPATSHHGGAGKATEAQAAHFRRYRGTVLIAADDDDPGYACALRRYALLREVGLRRSQLRIVRAADEIGGGLGMGADIADHVRAGYGLRELVELRPRDLDAAADRWAASEQQGARYGAAYEGLTPAELAAIPPRRPTVAERELLRKEGWRV